jgi:serine/threonine protein kinase
MHRGLVLRLILSLSYMTFRLPFARRQQTRRQVAIKTVKRDILTAKLFDNLQSEIQILKSLSHRHITRLHDIVVRVSASFFVEAHS